jgi:hypothetical protein
VTENFDATLRTGFFDQLSSATPSRSGARLAAILADIEKAFAAGFSRASVHEALNKSGFVIGFRAFVKSLYRARKKARALLASTASRTTTPAPPPAWTPAPAMVTQQVATAPAASTPIRNAGQPDAASPPPYRPGRIGEIARSQPDMAALAKEGRLYAAEQAAEKKRKALAALPNTPQK